MRVHPTLFRVAVSTIVLTAALLAASPAHAYQSGSTVNEVNYGAGRFISTSDLSGGASANSFTAIQGVFSSYGVMTYTGSFGQQDYIWAGMYCLTSCPTNPSSPGDPDIIQVGMYIGSANNTTATQVDQEFCDSGLTSYNVGYTPAVTDFIKVGVTYSGGPTASMRFDDLTKGHSTVWAITVPTWCRSSVRQVAGMIDETVGSGTHYSTLWADQSSLGNSFIQWSNTTTGSHTSDTWNLPMSYMDDTLTDGTVDGTTSDASCSGTPQVCTAWINSGVGGLYSW